MIKLSKLSQKKTLKNEADKNNFFQKHKKIPEKNKYDDFLTRMIHVIPFQAILQYKLNISNTHSPDLLSRFRHKGKETGTNFHQSLGVGSNVQKFNIKFQPSHHEIVS